MQKEKTSKYPIEFNEEIDLRALFNILLDGKRFIISITAFASLIGIIYSLLLPNIYQSTALLAPVNPSTNISGALGEYSSLAGLAGISLPDSDTGNSPKALQKIGSLSFFENNIMKNIYLPDLMAVKSWDGRKNILSYDDRIFEASSNTWVRDYKYPKKQIPSAQESFEKFISEHLTLSEEKKTGFITLSVKHQSPFIAKQWVELVIDEVNAFYRQKDKSDSEKALSYLNQQISMTSLSEVKQVIAKLLQEETKKLTLVEANQFYVFDYIDPPAIMEEKSSPKRIFICILFALFGGIMSILLVILRHNAQIKKTS